jgi:hypothetical protein
MDADAIKGTGKGIGRFGEDDGIFGDCELSFVSLGVRVDAGWVGLHLLLLRVCDS